MTELTRIGRGLLAVVAMIPGLAGPAAAEMYRWVDENGRVHYSDQPKDAPSGAIKPAAPAAAPSDQHQRMEKTRRLLNAWELERQDEREQRQEEQKKQAELKRKCTVARDELRRMREAGALYDLDDDGNRVYLSQQERDARERRFSAQIEQHCR